MVGLDKSMLPGVDRKLEQNNKSSERDRNGKFRNSLPKSCLEPNVKKVGVFKIALEFTAIMLIT